MSSFHKNHQRCQGACQQQDTADTEGWASIAVVSVAAADVTFKGWSSGGIFTGRVIMLIAFRFGSAVFPEIFNVVGFEVDRGAAVKTRRACVTCHRAVFPWLGRATYIALSGTQRWRESKRNPLYCKSWFSVLLLLPFYAGRGEEGRRGVDYDLDDLLIQALESMVLISSIRCFLA